MRYYYEHRFTRDLLEYPRHPSGDNLIYPHMFLNEYVNFFTFNLECELL